MSLVNLDGTPRLVDLDPIDAAEDRAVERVLGALVEILREKDHRHRDEPFEDFLQRELIERLDYERKKRP